MTWFQKWKASAHRLKLEVHALLLAVKDPRTPWYAKCAAAVVVAYALSPIDLIPDFIPVLGLLDDLLLVPLGVLLVREMIPVPVMDECRQAARAATQRGGSFAWAGAIIVAAVWVGLITLFVCFWSRR